MKRKLSVLLTIIAIFSLISCGTEEQVSSSMSTSEPTLTTNTSEQSSIEITSSTEEETSSESEEQSSDLESSSSSDGSDKSHGEESTSSEAPTTYHVTFLNYDESVLYETDVEEGQAAIYGGKTPTKASDDEYDYTFKGWDKDLSSITADVTTKA